MCGRFYTDFDDAPYDAWWLDTPYWTFDVLPRILGPRGVMVVIQARHLCVEMRGVKKHGALTVTSAIRGCFAETKVREEFLGFLAKGKEW